MKKVREWLTPSRLAGKATRTFKGLNNDLSMANREAQIRRQLAVWLTHTLEDRREE